MHILISPQISECCSISGDAAPCNIDIPVSTRSIPNCFTYNPGPVNVWENIK